MALMLRIKQTIQELHKKFQRYKQMEALKHHLLSSYIVCLELTDFDYTIDNQSISVFQ